MQEPRSSENQESVMLEDNWTVGRSLLVGTSVRMNRDGLDKAHRWFYLTPNK